MKARALGRFMSEFLEGLAGGKDAPEKEEAASPAVIPLDVVREAVAPTIRQIVLEMLQQAMAEEGPPPEQATPSGEQLDLIFRDAGRDGPVDPIAEATLRRVHDINERQARKDEEARAQGGVPETYDPNDPGSGKPWTAPDVVA